MILCCIWHTCVSGFYSMLSCILCPMALWVLTCLNRFRASLEHFKETRVELWPAVNCSLKYKQHTLYKEIYKQYWD
jgi:hypothetical protein